MSYFPTDTKVVLLYFFNDTLFTYLFISTLQKLQKNEVDPLQKKVDAIGKSGQALIQSAAPGVSTDGLESDVDSLNDRWALLNEKISDRERKLDTALLQSGKFKDALASLLDWLTEMEDLVDNQKPPSAEYKVVKAQMQEQKVSSTIILLVYSSPL